MKKPDFKRIFDEATEYAIFTMDLDRLITSWNRGAEILLGWSKEEVIGRLRGDIIFPKEDEGDLLRELERSREDGKAMDERWHVKKDGSRFWALGRMMAMDDDHGKTTGYVKILQDQTQRREYEQQLESLNEKLERFNEELETRVAERTEALNDYKNRLRLLVSELNDAEQYERRRLAGDLHDNLGQMLAVSKMELQMLKSDLPDNCNITHLSTSLGLIDDSIKYTRELMSDLRPPDDLKKDLGQLVKWLAERKSKYGLKVTVEDDNKPIPLEENLQLTLFQAVRELLFNVIKHSEVDEAQVTIKCLDNYVHVIVRDEGKGFNAEEMEGAEKSDGGFGLFNLQERFSLIGGKLKINSRPGEGTTVTIVVPIEGSGDTLHTSTSQV